MADHSQNITNAVNCFGGGPSTKWGQASGSPYTMTWGSSLWGEQNGSIPFQFIKVIDNSVSSDTTIELYRILVQAVNNTMTPTSDMITENLKSGDWYYVFPGGVTDNEDQTIASWTTGTGQSTSFTCQAAGSTTWG